MNMKYDFQLQRFKHFKTVKRLIDSKTDTGGSSGAKCLKLPID